MKFEYPILFLVAFLCLTGCIRTPDSEQSKITSKGKKYQVAIVIPVIRPSELDAAELTANAMALVKKYKRGNVVGNIGLDKVAYMYDEGPPIDDEIWLKHIKMGRWEAKAWNYEAGTTAHIYLRRTNSVGPPYVGKIEFMKDGKRLGFTSTSGGRNLPAYYRAMRGFGIFIP